jgi:uncharacterized membrane protein YdjX (TVP38/TMEM64 family)
MSSQEETDQSARLEKASSRWKFFGRVLLFIFAAAALGILGTHEPYRRIFSVEGIERIAGDLGVMGPAVIIAAGVISPVLFLPRWPICFAAGLLYGATWGTVLGTFASLLGATLQFFLARSFLAGFARRILSRSRLAGFTIRPEKAFTALFLLRAFPLSNFVVTNLMAGALHLRSDVYIAATALGMLPSSVMFAAWGKFAKKPAPGFLLLIFGVLTALTIGGILVQRQRSRWLAKGGADLP